MPKSIHYFSILTLILCFVACGTAPVNSDDSDTSESSANNTFDPSAGQDSSDETSTTPSEDTETDTTPSEDTETSDEANTTSSDDTSTDEPAGACTSETDMALINSGAVDAEANRCGPGCILNGTQCTIDCMTETIDISDACATCYAEMMSCSASNCAMACFADSESATCRTCVEESCGPQFEECSGIDSQGGQ
jgi:hypothetical protein